MTALDLLQQLHERGVILTPYPDGTVHCRAPKGVLTPDLLDEMRQHKDELHALVEACEERAAMAQYGGKLERPAAETLAEGAMPCACATSSAASNASSMAAATCLAEGHRSAGKADQTEAEYQQNQHWDVVRLPLPVMVPHDKSPLAAGGGNIPEKQLAL